MDVAGLRFQKTELGRQAVHQRSALSDPRLRMLLILCNGRTPLAQLRSQIGPQTEALLAQLLNLGLIEDADAAAHAAASEHIELAIPEPAPPAPAPAAAARPAPVLAPAPAPRAAPPAPDPERSWPRLWARPSEPPSELPSELPSVPPSVLPSELPSELPAFENATPSRLPELRAMKRRAMALVENLFGPNGGSHGPGILAARDEAELERALAAVHGSISVYQGRKRADALLQQVRQGPA